MDILMQILFGGYVGWMVSKPWSSKFFDILLGILGAMAASLVMNSFGLPGVSGYNLYSFIIALSGAASVIFLGRLIQQNKSFQRFPQE